MRDELKKTLDYLETISPNEREELKPLENLPKKRDSLVRLAGSALWNLTGSIKPPVFSPCHSPAKEGVFLGNVLDGDRVFGPLILPLLMFLFGVAVFGGTGTGKTTLVLNFILPALINSGVLVVCFDPTGQYGRIVSAIFDPEKILVVKPEKYMWNPLLPPKYLSVEEWKRIFLDCFRFLWAGDGMINLLREGLNYVFSNYSYPNPLHLKQWIDRQKFKYGDRNHIHWQSLKNRMDMLWDTFSQAWTVDSGYFSNSKKIDRSITFEMTMDSLTGSFFTDIFTEFLRCCQSPFSDRVNFVFIYEEAHTRFSVDIHRRETQILERVALQQARQQRKHGIGCVYVDQISGLFPIQVFGNLGTFILFRHVDERSLWRVSEAVGLDEDQRSDVRNLGQRRCIVFSHVC